MAGIQVVDVASGTEPVLLVVEICMLFNDGTERVVDCNLGGWWWTALLVEVVGGGVGMVNKAGKLGQGGGSSGVWWQEGRQQVSDCHHCGIMVAVDWFGEV